MLWANSQPPRCGSVKGFHACTNVAMRIPDSRSTAKRKWHIPPVCRRALLGATPPSGVGTRAAEGGRPYGEDGTRRSCPRACPVPACAGARSFGSHHLRSHDSGDLIHRKRSPFPVRGEGSWQATAGRPYGEDGTRRSETSSVIRLAGDRRMPPSPCAGKAFGGRPQGRRASLRLQNEKLETKNEIKKRM